MTKNRGIAIMMVLSAIMIISIIALEFVYSSNVNYRIAVNEKERLQAFYLAESALNLMKVELKIDKQAKSQLASSPLAQSISLNEPLCQQYPFSTALLRAFFVGGVVPGGGEAAPAEAEEALPEEGAEKTSEKGKSVTTFETETAQEFLSFNGDFDGECANEQAKLNLNYFASLDPSQMALSGTNQYDAYKVVVASFLKQERFKNLFKETQPEKIDEIVRNIADWTDKNDQINDFGNISRGAEESLYSETGAVKPRNSKFLSLEELHLVEGVKDDWFLPIENMFTIYGDNKVNVCLAQDDVIWALVLSYAGQNSSLPPIAPNNTELRKKVVGAVKFSCSGSQPQASKIAEDLNAALGIAPGTQSNFANYITTESRYFSLKLSGQVGNSMVKFNVVLDTKDNDPKKWKILYFKVF